MKAVSLTDRIKYFHCTDEGEEVTHGILVLLGRDQWPTKAVEIETQADFKKFYNNFVVTEQTQDELMNPVMALEAV